MGTQSATLGPGIRAEDVRAHLRRVLASAEFISSPRLRSFLSFVVETSLAGNSGHIKEAVIAVEVYGRRPDYNPQVDSAVRVEAIRLRTRLRQYYEGAGKDDSIRIALPKGAYIPAFHARPESGASVAPLGAKLPQRASMVWIMALAAVISASFVWLLHSPQTAQAPEAPRQSELAEYRRQDSGKQSYER